jgi:D-sedoheptulose 7-phosphate isomerase
MAAQRIYGLNFLRIMDYYKAIASGFQETIELISMSVDDLVPHIQQATELCSQALLNEHKILACGNGSGGALAQIFCSNMLHRYEHDRPALPAMALSSDASTISAIAATSGSGEIYAKQVRALGQSGDILLGIASGQGNASIIQAIRAAHDRDMTVIILSGGDCPDISSLLLPEDCQMHVNNPRIPRIVAMQTMLIHCICELIDQSLFGSYYS